MADAPCRSAGYARCAWRPMPTGQCIWPRLTFVCDAARCPCLRLSQAPPVPEANLLVVLATHDRSSACLSRSTHTWCQAARRRSAVWAESKGGGAVQGSISALEAASRRDSAARKRVDLSVSSPPRRCTLTAGRCGVYCERAGAGTAQTAAVRRREVRPATMSSVLALPAHEALSAPPFRFATAGG